MSLQIDYYCIERLEWADGTALEPKERRTYCGKALTRKRHFLAVVKPGGKGYAWQQKCPGCRRVMMRESAETAKRVMSEPPPLVNSRKARRCKLWT